MSAWAIHVPHRFPDEPLSAVAGNVRHLRSEDRDVMREVILEAMIEHGLETAGELLDHLGALEPHERRAMLDRARQKRGLPSTSEADEQQRVAGLIRRTGPELQRCAHRECTTVPTNGLGVPTTLDVVRWWCPAHEHLAEPGDLEPHGSGLRYAESGAIVPIDPDDDARERARIDSDRALRASRDADRAADAAELAEREQASREQLRAELPPYLRETVA